MKKLHRRTPEHNFFSNPVIFKTVMKALTICMAKTSQSVTLISAQLYSEYHATKKVPTERPIDPRVVKKLNQSHCFLKDSVNFS